MARIDLARTDVTDGRGCLQPRGEAARGFERTTINLLSRRATTGTPYQELFVRWTKMIQKGPTTSPFCMEPIALKIPLSLMKRTAPSARPT